MSGEPGVAVDPVRELAGLTHDGWLVGGAVRDRLLGRPTADFDVVCTAPPRELARGLGRAAGAYSFELSEAFGAWRVVAHDHSWQLDLMPLDGASIEEDLARRDLTVNAIARRLGEEEHVDPFGGLKDLSRRRLRAVRDDAFERDPLRTLRLARLACELGFAVDPHTLSLAGASAPALAGVAPERVFGELKRVVCAERALEGLALLERMGALAAVLPELARLRGIEQSRFHHLDVFEHTLATLGEAIALERDPERLAGARALEMDRVLSAPLANELTRWQALRFGALLHDIAKPQTRAVSSSGRVTFMGHDESGAQLGGQILRRLRASEKLCDHVAALARHHLRLGFLVHEMPLSRRAFYDYLTVTAPVALDVTVLSVADRLATRGDNSRVAIAKHLELAGLMVGEALDWLADPPRPPLRGDELARALEIVPGPRVGELLRELTAASFAGEIGDREEAVAYARELIRADDNH